MNGVIPPTLESPKSFSKRKVLEKLNDEGVEVIWESHDEVIDFAVVLTCEGSIRFIADLITVLQSENICLKHLETRIPEKNESCPNNNFDVLIKCQSDKINFLKAARILEDNPVLLKLKVYKDAEEQPIPWYPRCIEDLDLCNHVLMKYEPEIDSRHPAYGDESYMVRRKEIANIAMEYKIGFPIPRVEYTASEIATWTEVYTKLRDVHETHACAEFLRNIEILEKAELYGPDTIPQLEEVSRLLKSKTGFRIRPCAGLLSARDFLASLAFRVFQGTQYVRHGSSPHHTPEPDVIHELIGHVPMFCDPNFAQFSQEIGLASLGASDEDIEKLSAVYVYSIEFGLCKEGENLKVCGAGLLSSFGEMQHAISGKPELRPFDAASTAVTPYQDEKYQSVYYVADSAEDATNKFRRWARGVKRPFSVAYDPYTQSVHEIRHPQELGPTHYVNFITYNLTSG